MPLVKRSQIRTKKTRKNIINKFIIILLFLSLSCVGLSAQENSSTSEPAVQEAREFNESRIQELKESGDFDYVERRDEPPSLLQRIMGFIGDLIGGIFRAATSTPLGKLFLYIALFILVLVAIIKIFSINIKDVFYGSADKGKTDFEFLEENLHELDLDKLLVEALAKEDFRLAIRLEYLKALRALSEAQIIDWEQGKTNYEYLYQLETESLKQPFKDLCYYFDYAWYGDFEIEKPIYDKAKAKADSLTQQATREEAKVA